MSIPLTPFWLIVILNHSLINGCFCSKKVGGGGRDVPWVIYIGFSRYFAKNCMGPLAPVEEVDAGFNRDPLFHMFDRGVKAPTTGAQCSKCKCPLINTDKE